MSETTPIHEAAAKAFKALDYLVGKLTVGEFTAIRQCVEYAHLSRDSGEADEEAAEAWVRDNVADVGCSNNCPWCLKSINAHIAGQRHMAALLPANAGEEGGGAK